MNMEYPIDTTEKTGYLNQEFRLFYLKDQKHQNFTYHYHDFYKVIIFLSGKATYHIEGKSYYLNPWDILLVDKYSIHKPEISSEEPYERFILWIRNDLKEELLTRCFQKATDRCFHLVRLPSKMQKKLEQVLSEFYQSSKHQELGDAILEKALFYEFMVYLNRIFLEKQYICDQDSYAYDSRIEELLKYINRNLEKELSIEELSRKYFLSKYYMMRKFKEETGYTIHSYIVSKRLFLAKNLISQGFPVTKAALQSGFKDYTAFIRAYKKQFGELPSEALKKGSS